MTTHTLSSKQTPTTQSTRATQKTNKILETKWQSNQHKLMCITSGQYVA